MTSSPRSLARALAGILPALLSVIASLPVLALTPAGRAEAAPAAEPAQITALTGATVHPVSGPDIPNGVVIFAGARISAVGPAGQVVVPPAAHVIQLGGKHVYPGFVAPGAPLGLVEIGSVRGPTDTREMGSDNANLRTEVAFNADSLLIGPAVAGGVLYVHVQPAGGVVAGSSAVMRLDGWNWTDMTLRAPVGMHLYYPRLTRFEGFFFSQPEEEFQKQKDKAIKALGDIFDAARAYKTAREAALAGKGPAVEVDPRPEAMRPVLDGKLPLYIHAREKAQIEGALDWAKREKLANLVLVTGPDAQYVAERLAKEKVPVILDGVLELPDRRWEPYDAAYAAAIRLHRAGVKFAIGDNGDASNVRNLPFHAAMAASFGLPREIALRSITLSAAELLGVADRVGSLDPGKEASLFIADGDPLEAVTHIERVWIAGREIDLAHERQRQLYDRYRNRPKPAPAPAAPGKAPAPRP